MVSGELCLAADNDFLTNNMKEMIGGCCVCSDERGWAENPLVYCDGHGCNVAVHQACYGIVQVPTGPWFCRKCESQERAARVVDGCGSRAFRSFDGPPRKRCELCPHKDGALKRTDNGGWAHVVCALYIPEVEFANVSTMEPIVLQSVPHDRYNKTCYICEDQGRESKAATGACMTCNKHGCRQAFHVTCAQFAGLLCEEQGSDADNVKYCGYCKYHYSKLRRRRVRGNRGLIDSSQCWDKPPDHQDHKKHKERDRHKPKHKKTLELSPSLAPALMVASDKSYNSGGVPSMPASSQKRLDDSTARFTTANFQEVPVHSGGAKDASQVGSEGKQGSEVKQNKKSVTGHVIGGQRGRKSLTPGKPLPSAVVTTATSSTAASSTGTFHQGLLLSNKTPSTMTPPTSDFLGFSDPSLRSRGGDSFSPPSFSRCLVKPGEVTAPEGMASLGTFGSMMSLPASGGITGSKLYENSHSEPTGNVASTAGYKRPQPSSSSSSSSSATSSAGPGIGVGGGGGGGGSEGGGEEGVKGKKKRGNWRNRYGPCFNVPDSKATDGPEHHTTPLPLLPSSSLSSSTASPSPSSTSALPGRPGGGGGLLSAGVSTGAQKSPSLLNGSLQSHRVTSTPSATGTFSSGDVSSGVGPVAMGGANSELPQQQPPPSLAPPAPFTATAPLTSTASSHVSGLPGPVFNMAPSHMFGNRLNPNSAMAALIAQCEVTPADQEVGDGNGTAAQGFPRRVSPKTALSPRSPLGGLQIWYDPAGSLGSGSGLGSRLGLGLGAQGSGQVGGGDTTAPPVATSIEQLLERQWSEGQQFLLQQGAQGDVLGMLKSLHQLQQENSRLESQIKTLTMKKERLQLLSAQLSVPFTPATTAQDVKSDSSLPMPTQDSVSCGRSSGGSTSSLSTPPSVSHSPPQPPQLNGVAMGTLMLGGGTGLGLGGAAGALNGVIQTTCSPHTYTPTSAPGTSGVNNRSGTVSEQQRMLLHQHQVQQLFSSQSSVEQQQVLLYQLMQQHQDLQQLQSLSSSQLPSIPHSSAQPPVTTHLSSSNAHGQGTITANPFLALHSHHPDTNAHAGAHKPRLADKAGSVTGQEKT
ncbi:protein AF-10 isoform X2 [Esox lucius]|uniref:protein AF-10 isoform X2 n=1 Tax=Esox lucius TaxID=8010 RepID=UPI0014774664|nr:protein AF-10 isoform X2 [Esox lucius]